MTGFTNWLRRICFLGPPKDRWKEAYGGDQECVPVRMKISVRNSQQFGMLRSLSEEILSSTALPYKMFNLCL